MTEGNDSPQSQRIEIKEEDLPPERQRIVIREEDLAPAVSSEPAREHGTSAIEGASASDGTEPMYSDGETIPSDTSEDFFANNASHSQGTNIETAVHGIGGVAAESSTKTTTPVKVSDEREGFPMAANVKADEVIPHVPGVNASVGDSEYIDSNASDDVARGYDVASSGHYFRSEAANTRRDVLAEKKFKDDLYAIVNDPRFLDKRFRSIMKRVVTGDYRLGKWVWGTRLPDDISDWAYQQILEMAETRGRGRGENRDIGWNGSYDALHSSSDVLEGRYDPDAPFREGDLEEARRDDERAAEREKWAELLHDQPVSETYKKAHPDFGFGVREMMRLEQMVEQNGGKSFEGGEGAMEVSYFDNPVRVGFAPVVDKLQAAIERFVNIMLPDDQDLLLQCQETMTAETSTLSDLVDLYKQVGERVNSILEARIEERKQVLADVKSGRASKPDYKPPEPSSSPTELDERTRDLIDEEGREDRE